MKENSNFWIFKMQILLKWNEQKNEKSHFVWIQEFIRIFLLRHFYNKIVIFYFYLEKIFHQSNITWQIMTLFHSNSILRKSLFYFWNNTLAEILQSLFLLQQFIFKITNRLELRGIICNFSCKDRLVEFNFFREQSMYFLCIHKFNIYWKILFSF